jgi:D-alanine transaminase
VAEVYLNGSFVAPERASVSVMDRGFLFGDGVYEVIPSYGGYFLGLAQHLDRLDASLSAIRLGNPLSRDAWHAVFARLLGPPPAADQYVYLQITRGAPDERDHLCAAGVSPTVFAMARPIKARRSEVEAAGVACVTRPDIRWHRCEIKSVSLLAAVMMRREAEDEGAMETIMIRDGRVTEGSSTNVFVVKDGALFTPPKGQLILPGITRDLVIGLARDAGLPLGERPIPSEELRSADEIWLSSSTRELLPVTRLDGGPVGSGAPGPVWRRMDNLYQAYKERIRRGAA